MTDHVGDFKDMSDHFYRDSVRRGRDNDVAQLMMGISSVAFGGVMTYNAAKRMFEGKKGRSK